MSLSKQALDAIREAHKTRHPVFLQSDLQPITYESRIAELDEKRQLLKLVNNVPRGDISEFRKSARFFVQFRMLRLQANKLATDGVNFVFPLGETFELEETRQSERLPFRADEKVYAMFTNPLDGVTPLAKPVLDLSAAGLSIAASADSELFMPGLKIGDIKITIDGKLYSQVQGTVVYKRKLFDMHSALRSQVGIKTETPTEPKA